MSDAITAYTDLKNLVMSRAMTLEERLARILSSDGGRGNISPGIKVDEVHGFNGMSGFNYWKGDDLIAQLYMGTLQSGTYVIYKKTYIDGVLEEMYDYYDNEGNFFYESKTLDGNCITYSSIAMDPTNPMINHIYNILHVEYEGTTFNFGNTGRIKFLEGILAKFYKGANYKISANDGLKDQAIKNIRNEILTIENDRVLKWSERQTVFSQLKQVRSKILATKRRAHHFQYMLYDFLIMCMDIEVKAKRFKQRPLDNFIGSLYKHTLGNLFWFCNTVRSNLGYSVAMAIYGPFTFYFITQPMNPHAMWAVGKVRKAYIEVVKVMDTGAPKEPVYVVEADEDEKSDSVSTKQAAVQKPTAVVPGKKISWGQRMDNFKAMQIAYEGDMVFAARMGRVEQFETQYNFPLTAEAAWMEMELYLKKVEADLSFFKNLDPKYISFLNNEKERTIELQFYIWQKMGQFFLDHPYIVVDQDKEQPEKNYYLGRQFIFFKTMTEKLSEIGIANNPITHKNVEALASKFTKMKVAGSSVLDTLKKNSKLFQQKDYLDTAKLRDYMKDQWEVLFLQQNKKQEASSFALQSYTWSIRNAMWLLQTIYSSKRVELGALTYKYNMENIGTHGTKASAATNEYIENMFHNLVMEFTSIKSEMAENLPGDKEAQLRKNVINNIKSYIIERDKLFNTDVYASNPGGSTTI